MRDVQGFTLIELMIVIAIVAVIAAIAIPSYTEQVRKGRRAEAARAIGQLQLDLERWRAENPDYAECATCTAGTYPTLPVSDFYTTAIVAATPAGYTITATPTPGSAQNGDRCGALSATRDTKPTWAEAACN